MTVKELKEKLELLIEDGYEDNEIFDKSYYGLKIYVIIDNEEVYL